MISSLSSFSRSSLWEGEAFWRLVGNFRITSDATSQPELCHSLMSEAFVSSNCVRQLCLFILLTTPIFNQLIKSVRPTAVVTVQLLCVHHSKGCYGLVQEQKCSYTCRIDLSKTHLVPQQFQGVSHPHFYLFIYCIKFKFLLLQTIYFFPEQSLRGM